MHRLIPHPASANAPALDILVDVSRGPGVLSLRYGLGGDVDRIKLAPRAEPGRADGLWRQTCLEAFVRVGDAAGYCEFNFSPSAQWAAYAFSGYREGMAPLASAEPPRIEIEHSPGRLELRAQIAFVPFAGAMRLGLSAVIETLDGAKTYWALTHPAERPDFHHPDCFTLELGETPRP